MLSYKSSNVHVKSMCYSQIWQNFGGDEYLCKLGKEYLNALLCKFVTCSLQHSETFDVSNVFLTLTITELSALKQICFFWPTLYICNTLAFCLKLIFAELCTWYILLERLADCNNIWQKYFRCNWLLNKCFS